MTQDDELMQLWQQGVSSTPDGGEVARLAARASMRRFDRLIARRNVIESLAAVGVMTFFGWNIAMGHARAANALSFACVAFVVAYLWWRHRHTVALDPAANAEAYHAALVAGIDGQIDLLRTVWSGPAPTLRPAGAAGSVPVGEEPHRHRRVHGGRDRVLCRPGCAEHACGGQAAPGRTGTSRGFVQGVKMSRISRIMALRLLCAAAVGIAVPVIAQDDAVRVALANRIDVGRQGTGGVVGQLMADGRRQFTTHGRIGADRHAPTAGTLFEMARSRRCSRRSSSPTWWSAARCASTILSTVGCQA